MGVQRIDLAAVLEKTALLSGLSQPELQLLAARTVRKLFSAGELLFSEGEPCNGLHIIARGKVRIFKTSRGGREQVLAVNVPASPSPRYPSSMAVRTLLPPWPLKMLRLRSSRDATFRHTAWNIRKLRSKCWSWWAPGLRRLVGIIEELSFTTIRQRLISVLLKLAQSEGKNTGRGIEFQLPASHQELANQLGTVRELISRNLMRLQAEGLLDVDARQIVVKDMKGLSALLDAAS